MKKVVLKISTPHPHRIGFTPAVYPHGTSAGSHRPPPPSHEFYIYDGANIISEGTAQYIIEANRVSSGRQGSNCSGNHPFLKGKLSKYGNVLFRHWGIGSAQENNGVLLLIALEERQVWIEVGYGLKGPYPMEKQGKSLTSSSSPIPTGAI